MDLLTNLPSKYCRICFEDKQHDLNPMSKEIRENFHSLTNIHVSIKK
jgi:hypothetical protein